MLASSLLRLEETPPRVRRPVAFDLRKLDIDVFVVLDKLLLRDADAVPDLFQRPPGRIERI